MLKEIAVVIPVYNCKKYLKEAVDSVLRQPYQKISIVLVDDGSTDGSGQLCDELAAEKSRITALHQKNSGVSVARNAVIEYVLSSDRAHVGVYIAFLNADDCWTENFFSDDSVSALPNVEMIRFQSVNCNLRLNRCLRETAFVEEICEGGASTVRKGLTAQFGAALYAASLFDDWQIRFTENMKYSEDVLFLRTCLYRAKSVAFYNRILYLYRNNPTSLVHNRKNGFEYFEPMFQAYMLHDFDGCGFVAWYFVDAIEEHFKFGGSVAEAKRWIAEHPTYLDIARKYGGNRATNVLTALERFPHRYSWKLRIRGIAFNVARRIIHIPPFSFVFAMCRYRNKIPNSQQ